jgi:hypothetical protein
MLGKGKTPQRTAIEPGRKTPRRIQWLDEDANGQDRTGSPVHILDPSGEDVRTKYSFFTALDETHVPPTFSPRLSTLCAMRWRSIAIQLSPQLL